VSLETERTPATISEVGGRLAQLGERIVRNDEAGGSNPLPSTNSLTSAGTKIFGQVTVAVSCLWKPPFGWTNFWGASQRLE
jgi:hypothetical protein